MKKESYRSKWIKCGKKCSGCPHGPYWYAYWWEGGRQRSRYVGKELPGVDPSRGQSAPSPWDAIFERRTASPELAAEILGLRSPVDLAKLQTHYRVQMMENHPDRGGDEHKAKQLNCAYEYLKTWLASR